MGTQTVDYSALAQKARDSAPAASSTDYAALADQARKAGAPQSWGDKLASTAVSPMAQGPLHAIGDFAEGAVSGAASTVFHGGDLIRRIFGMPRVINNPDVQQAMKTPDSVAGKVGKTAEQVAEFAIPASKVGTLAKGANFLTRAGAQAATAAAVSGAQTGGDPASMALAGATGAAGEGVSAALGQIEIPQAMRTYAERLYGKALAATTKQNKFLSKNEVVPELLDRGVSALTQKGLLAKANTNVADLGHAIGEAWEALPEGASVPVEGIFDTLEGASKKLFTAPGPAGEPLALGPHAAAGIKRVSDLADTIAQHAVPNPQTGVLEVPAATLRRVRQYFDSVAADSGRFAGRSLADASEAEAHGMAADAIREELSKQYPSIAEINKEYSFWKNVQRVVGDTVLRREGQVGGLTKKIAGAAGAAVGGANAGIHGAILGKVAAEQLEAAMSSAGWRTVSANYVNQLSRFLAKGDNAGANRTIAQITKALATAGASKATESEPAPVAEAQQQ
jgi:hypothetical protein